MPADKGVVALFRRRGMRTFAFFVFSVVVMIGGFSRPADAGERAAQTLCPVTGKKLATVTSPVEVRANGFRFQVADVASSEKALKEPAKAFAALARNSEAAEPVSQACPVMGNRINRSLFIQKNGYRVYICCKGCTKRVENNWEGTLWKLEEQAERGDADNLPTM